MSQQVAPGTRLGPYEVLDRLGAGGMGEVWRARDTRLGRTVAVKVIRAESDPELLRRLDREARAASALNHPAIVHIYDVGQAAGETGPHYVVMEHVAGETLRRRLGRPLPMPQLLDWGAQMAEGLACAHASGIVHRDLKPENVMVTADGFVKILDFGLAKLTGPPLGDVHGRATLSRHATAAGMLVGTVEYMSPEQASGRAVDHRADQFALGLVLYEMAAGHPPFPRSSAVEVLAALLERQAEPLGRFRPDAPAALEALVARCLEKDPARRFDETAELARRLRTIGASVRDGIVARDDEPEAPPPRSPVPSAVSADEIIPAPARAMAPETPSRWSVQVGSKVRAYEEAKLADAIRRGKLTGLELARREQDDRWQPLYESRVYRREVPEGGDPRRSANLRVLRELGQHYSGFAITGCVMLFVSGELPFWLGIWAVAGLVPHTIKSLPAALFFWREQQAMSAASRPPLPAPPTPRPALPPSPAAAEAARVRALLEQRGGDDTPRLVAEVDGIVRLTSELRAREADLEEQTSEAERNSLLDSVAAARARIERAETAQDRQLFERQLEVVERRLATIDKARRVVERIRVRREMAEHQLKQLRLDLARGAAFELGTPELSSRLQFIRHEVDAAEDVEEMLAGR